MIRSDVSGSFESTDSFLREMMNFNVNRNLDRFAKMGVEALKQNTPVRSGATAEAWTYEIVTGSGQTTIWWNNTNVVNGFNVAVGLRYGHGTGNGGYVKGENFITPALKPIFDKIADAVWEEVRNA